MNKMHLTKKERRVVILFLFFPLTLLIFFGILPLILLICYSMTSWNGISPEKIGVGLENYRKILTDPNYFKVFMNSGYYFLSGTIEIIIALYFAIILSFKVRFQGFFKVLFIIPLMISGVAVSMMFRLFFMPGGTLDTLLTTLGLESWIRYWLGDPRQVNYTLGAISMWRHIGMSFILYFGAIQMIPNDYYKVAELEGASFWQKVRTVIFPQIHLVIEINFILLMIGALSVFEVPMIMTNGSNGTMTFLLQTMKTAFEQKQVGLAASMAILQGILILILTWIRQRWCGKDATNQK